MRKFEKPRCPYCGKKLSLPSTWIIKSQGEFLCPKCGGISNIVLDRAVYLFAFLTVLLGAFFFILSYLQIREFNVWLLLMVFIPFFLFFLLSVFLVRLKKPESHGKNSAPPPIVPKITPPEHRGVPSYRYRSAPPPGRR